MYASIIDATFKEEDKDEAIALAGQLVDELSSRVEGLRGFMILDRGAGKSTAIAVYDSEANWAAAAPVAQEILGKLGPYMSAMPERTGSEVLLGKRYATD